MGSSRQIHFKLDNNNRTDINFGIYCIMMYYAAQVNPVRSKRLFNASLNEWEYRVEYELDKGDLTSNDWEAHYVYADLQDIVPFINNEVIPALSNEPYDEILTQKYSGVANFMDIYYQSEDYLTFFGLAETELFDGNKYSMRGEFKALKDFFQVVVQQNKLYEVWVD